MNINIFIICSIFFSFVTPSTLNCNFKYETYEHPKDKKVYQCLATNNGDIWTKKRVKIEAITGKHENNKENINVEGFSVASKLDVNYLPEGLEKFFPKLSLINAQSSGLLEIKPENFKNFPDLKFVYLSNNKIERISKEHFSQNANLEVVWLDKNSIVHIDLTSFIKNTKIFSLRLDNNFCYGRFFNAETENDVKRVSQEILNGHCFNEELDKIYQEIDNKTAIIRQQDEKIETLKEKIKTLIISLYSFIGVIVFLVIVMIILVISIVVMKCNVRA
ncbi:hypothetical protein PVAND_015566 [Polypedilum vanderplanki]|uniref:Uncharacterized protein n=1 Tax=Polypedilum vanderplanki TaxID=319348 RepID=A0A9J6BDH4_POLVA|nr:hypothetical protein PVAND_015566 [Polypedilum vanderplanki]